MSVLCLLGWHRPRQMPRWNDGFYFSSCQRCGRDLVRTAFEDWHVPRGQQVVWSSPEPGVRLATLERANLTKHGAEHRSETCTDAESREAEMAIKSLEPSADRNPEQTEVAGATPLGSRREKRVPEHAYASARTGDKAESREQPTAWKPRTASRLTDEGLRDAEDPLVPHPRSALPIVPHEPASDPLLQGIAEIENAAAVFSVEIVHEHGEVDPQAAVVTPQPDVLGDERSAGSGSDDFMADPSDHVENGGEFWFPIKETDQREGRAVDGYVTEVRRR